MSRIPGVGFPHSMLAKLRYCDNYTLSITTGSVAKQFMRLNSIFDPDYTGTGHQPLYRDTFAAIYDQYAVVSCEVEVKVCNLSTTAVLETGIVLEDDTSSSGDSRVLKEQATGSYTILPPLAGSLSTHTFRYRWDCKKTLHIDPFSSETYKTQVGTNPTEEADLCIWASVTDGISSTVPVLTVTMLYEVLFTELQTPSIS